MSISSRNFIEVGVAMVLKDRFSQEAGKISNSFRSMMNDMSVWNRGIQMSASNTFDFGTQLLGGMARAYKYSAGVQNEVWTAAKIAGATINEQRQMLQLAKDVNQITPLTASDVASGERYLAMAGNKFDAIKEMIGPASKLASIFNMPVGGKGGVADLVTNIMSMYQMPMSNAASVTDDLYTAATNANMSLTDLAQSIAYAGADMATAGVDLRQTAAAIGVLGDMGIQGSMAGTSLANMIRYLQLSLVNKKKNGYNALQSLGLSPEEFFDAQGNLIDLYSIYQKFAKAAVDLPSRLETPTFFDIFGVRGNRGMIPVLKDIAAGRDKMGMILSTYNKNRGIVDYVNAERLNTPAGMIDQLTSSVENLTVTLGQSLGPLATLILKVGNWGVKAVNSIAETWAGSFTVKVVATSVVVGTMIAGFRVLRGIMSMASYVQQKTTASSVGMSAAVSSTNAQYKLMEAHLVYIGQLLRHNVMLQMRAQGLYYDKNGRLRGPKGRFTGLPMVPIMPPPSTAGAPTGGTGGRRFVGGGSMLPGGTSTFARWGLKHGWSKGLISGIGGALAFGSKLMPGWGLALSIGLPLLVEGISLLTNSVDRNTASRDKQDDPNDTLRSQYEEKFIQAVRLAIQEGMRSSSINIAIDGQSVGGYTPGSQGDFTGINYVMGL